MATMVVRMALDSDGIPFGGTGRTADPPLWGASIADYGYCVRNPTNNVFTPTTTPGVSLPFFLDTGDLALLATAVGSGTITSVTVTLEHMITKGGAGTTANVEILCEKMDHSQFAFFGGMLPSDVVSSDSTYVTNSTAAKLTDPGNGAAWTMAKLQNYVFRLDVYTQGADITYHCDLFYITVAYTPGAPSSVSITGSGGALASGEAGTGRGITGSGGVEFDGDQAAFAAGTGPAAELHLNQWGLEAFSLYTDLEEHL